MLLIQLAFLNLQVTYLSFHFMHLTPPSIMPQGWIAL